MHKLTRSQQVAWAKEQLTKSRGCPLCLRSWTEILADAAKKGLRQAPYVVDHNHKTGEVRGLLCRGCNGAEGKVTNAVAAWGKTGLDPDKVHAWLKRMLEHNTKKGHGVMYSTHVLEEDKKRKAADRRKTLAQARAKARRLQVGK